MTRIPPSHSSLVSSAPSFFLPFSFSIPSLPARPLPLPISFARPSHLIQSTRSLIEVWPTYRIATRDQARGQCIHIDLRLQVSILTSDLEFGCLHMCILLYQGLWSEFSVEYLSLSLKDSMCQIQKRGTRNTNVILDFTVALPQVKIAPTFRST